MIIKAYFILVIDMGPEEQWLKGEETGGKPGVRIIPSIFGPSQALCVSRTLMVSKEVLVVGAEVVLSSP